MSVANEYDKLDEFLEYFISEKKYERDIVLALSLLCATDEQMDELLDYAKANEELEDSDILSRALEIGSRDDVEEGL